MSVKNGYNTTRKEYFHTLVIGDKSGANGEKDFTFFNKNSGSTDGGVFDTNWCASDNAVPAHIIMKLLRIGFSAVGAVGDALTVATLANLAKSIVTVKIGDREILNESLLSFMKIPGANSASLISDFNTGPSYKEILEETANAKDVIDFEVHIPANIGQQIRLTAILDTINSAKQG
jgi:hypothetical protein